MCFFITMQRNKIYKNKQWKQVREQVLQLDHYECQRCNHNVFTSDIPKRVTKAYLVHHIWYADKYPEYKYQIYVDGKRNLVSLCNDCHEILHNRKSNGFRQTKDKFSNEERFD